MAEQNQPHIPVSAADAQATAPGSPLVDDRPGLVDQDAQGDDDGQRRPNTCRCGARWAGTRTAHCGACHHTMSGVGPFDAHRAGGKCTPPAELGMTLAPNRSYPCWGYGTDGHLPPPTEAEMLADGTICQPGQPFSCADAHSAGHCAQPREKAGASR